MANEFVLPSDMPDQQPQQQPPKQEATFNLPSDAPPPKHEPQAAETWADVPMQALKNAPASAYKFGQNVVQPFMHPQETVENIGNLGKGLLQKSGILSGDSHTKYADAIWDDLAERYGGMENLKKTLSTDPVGVMADASMVLTGGGMAAARAPGMIGRAGEIAKAAGRLSDPLLPVAKTAQFAGKGAAEVIGGLGTHTGHEALETAANAGYQGGERAKAFRENIRGIAPLEDTVDDALSAVENMKKARGDIYNQEIAGLKGVRRVLPFNKIDDAMRDITQVKTFTGPSSGIRVSIDPATAAIRSKIQEEVFKWKNLPPQDFHTAEGLDALKQKLGGIARGTERGTPESKVAWQAYSAVRGTIVKAYPEYAKIMKGYERASDTLDEITRTLSLGDKATVDTSLRKLQSILRDNVSTSYGHRRELAQFLIDNGSPMLKEQLAGQALRPFLPRGLGKVTASIAAEMGALGGFGLAAGAGAAMKAVPAFATMSPRIMGESAYYAGRGMRGAELGSRPAYYTGRIGQAQREADEEEARKKFKVGPNIRINGQ